VVCLRWLSAAIQVGCFVFGDWDLFGNLDVEALQGWDVRWRVREQADFVDTQVSQDLATQADLAQRSLVAVVVMLAGARFAVQDDTVGRYGPVDVEAAAGVVQVDERASALLGDGFERTLHDAVAIAECGAEDVACEAVRVHAH